MPKAKATKTTKQSKASVAKRSRATRELGSCIAKAIDAYLDEHPRLKVGDVVCALADVANCLIEAGLRFEAAK